MVDEGRGGGERGKRKRRIMRRWRWRKGGDEEREGRG